MAGIVEVALPWVHVDREASTPSVVSMGGQEALLALAFHPEHWAAVLSVDGVADLAARYREFSQVDRLDVRPLMRDEVGGTPRSAPFAYAVRSPITFVRTIATSRCPARDLVERRRPARHQPDDDADGPPVQPDPRSRPGCAGGAAHRDGVPRPDDQAGSRTGHRLSVPRRGVAYPAGGARTVGVLGLAAEVGRLALRVHRRPATAAALARLRGRRPPDRPHAGPAHSARALRGRSVPRPRSCS